MDIQQLLNEFDLPSDGLTSLAGGDINQVYRAGNRVYKVNRSDDFPRMFEKEAKGLRLLNQAIRTPEVKGSFDNGQHQLLALEYIPSGSKKVEFWEGFATVLSRLHQITQEDFGLDHDNYMGSIRQSNRSHANWTDFLIEERLQPMIEMAVNAGEVNYVEAKVIEDFYQKVDELYPKEPPALIHGDLWGGNYICAQGGEVVLIDPAAYFGHREMDIGMMHLFGGFDQGLFEAYNEQYPLESQWKSRIKINQLYPLLIHVNIFGRSYWNQVSEILKPFRTFRS